MTQEPAIRFHHVSKKFTLTRGGPRTIQESLLAMVNPRRRAPKETMWAVKDAHFNIMPGEAVGFVGRNGSGKSTLLKLATRIYEPTDGFVNVLGRASALLELGAGFHQDLTGRENIYMNGAMLGLSRKAIKDCFDAIIAFSELEKFIDVPVRHYSSGMYMRLAFSVAVHVQPDVLFIDEILAVGDQAFQSKCIDRVFDIKQGGATIVMVSHNLRVMQNLCDRLIWIDRGDVRMDDNPHAVINKYDAYSQEILIRQQEKLAAGQRSFKRWGTREVEIDQVRLLNEHGEPQRVFNTGDGLEVELHYRVNERVRSPRFSLAIFRWDGMHANNPHVQPLPLEEELGEDGVIRYRISRLPLRPAAYFLSVAVHDANGLRAYDYHDRGYPFTIANGNEEEGGGMIDLDATWLWDERERVR